MAAESTLVATETRPHLAGGAASRTPTVRRGSAARPTRSAIAFTRYALVAVATSTTRTSTGARDGRAGLAGAETRAGFVALELAPTSGEDREEGQRDR